MPQAEIVSQGDEVITGQVADTNAAWLSEQLTGLGFIIGRHTTVGDHLEDIQQALREVAQRTEVCICTGGLGPTEDDLTAQAVAKAFDRPLAFDSEAMSQITQRYRRADRDMPAVNEKQAWLPKDAKRLDNQWGTAPGFAIDQDQVWMAFLPGVPTEMREMFNAHVIPALHHRFSLQPGRLVTLRTCGVGESTLQERIGPLGHSDVVLSYRTKLPENHIKLRFPAHFTEEQIAAITGDVAQRIGSPLFSIDGLPGEAGGGLAEVVGRILVEHGESLSTAESCTGGRIASLFTAVSGSSAWFVEGIIAYANAAKIRHLGVSDEMLETHGAVSEPVARQMAIGARQAAGTTYGIASTGIAGPTGGTPDKPVGTVHLALATPDTVHHRHFRLPGDRARVQDLTASVAIDMLRRYLQNNLRT